MIYYCSILALSLLIGTLYLSKRIVLRSFLAKIVFTGNLKPNAKWVIVNSVKWLMIHFFQLQPNLSFGSVHKLSALVLLPNFDFIKMIRNQGTWLSQMEWSVQCM